jgi:prolipoprotein diacylglyceryl transferase
VSSTSTVLAYIPSPPQGVWQLGPFPLRAYALFIITGIVVAVWWGEKRWVARGGVHGTISDIAIWAVPFGLVGGRLYHVATDNERYFGPGKNPVNALKIWDGGLGIWGAVLLGGVGAWIACRRKGIPLPALADAIGAPIVVAQAIGRIGNYFNQELYGRATTLPWGLEIFPRVDGLGRPDELNGTVPDGAAAVAVVQPTFLYELLWDLVVAVVVVWADRRFRLGHGRAFALYVAGYCVGRLGVELLRSDPATMVLGIRINVFTAVIVFLAAVAYIVLAPKGREDPASLSPGAAAGGAVGAGAQTAVDDGKADDGAVHDGAAGNGAAGNGAAGLEAGTDDEPAPVPHGPPDRTA